MDYPDPNHLWGPFRRSDVVAAVCLGLAIYVGVVEREWESFAFALTLVLGTFAGLSPRFRDDIYIKVKDWLQLGATLDPPPKPPRLQASAPIRVQRKGRGDPRPELSHVEEPPAGGQAPRQTGPAAG
jgi:hypothetical protein